MSETSSDLKNLYFILFRAIDSYNIYPKFDVRHYSSTDKEVS